MAKPKITVSYLGAVIGTRSTDRKYTHAVIATDFRADDYRVLREREWQDRLPGIKRLFAGNAERVSPTYKYASVISDAERARYAAEQIAGEFAFVAGMRAAHDKSVEQAVANPKVHVISYHGSADLAHKAASAAWEARYWSIRVVPVNS